MKILLLSDIHTEFTKNNFPTPKTDAECIILAGDIGLGINNILLANKWQKELNIPIIIINGNHEYYNNSYYYNDAEHLNLNLVEMLQLKQSALCEKDVHFLENQAVVINDVRFLGCTLWTNFRTNPKLTRQQEMTETQHYLNDYAAIYFNRSSMLKPEHTLKVHEKSRRWLSAQLKKDFPSKTVIITHHAPTLEGVAPIFRGNKNGGFCNKMDGFLKTHHDAIDLWCFGHTHFNIDTTIEGVRCCSNQCGYPNELIDNFDPLKIIEV